MIKILVVDDSEHIRNFLSETFTLMGSEVVAVGGGNEALDLFFGHSFDLVITDLEMADMDGWALASHIKERSPDIPIVLITGSEKSAVMESSETSNVDAVLLKPFSLNDIKDTVKKALALKTIESENASSTGNSPGTTPRGKGK
jgi:two-component system cell cycle response regulator CpdR